jgi:hypothetical protein
MRENYYKAYLTFLSKDITQDAMIQGLGESVLALGIKDDEKRQNEIITVIVAIFHKFCSNY